MIYVMDKHFQQELHLALARFWAFLLGVCLIAAALTILEAVANPYTTVLGGPDFGPDGLISRNLEMASFGFSAR